MTAPPDDTTTDLHSVIASLQAERDAGLAREAALTEALATRNSAYGERIEQQAATIDVLKVMSASPGNARPVFELIVERARSFCAADHATAALLHDDMLHLQAYSGMSAAYGADYAAQFPRPVDTSTMFGRAVLSRNVMQTGNLRAEPDHFARQMQTAAFHSIVALPILREGTPIGAIALGRNASGGFSDTQIELLKTFAEQAVIAITSAETYRALQTRTSDLQESLEYQTATSDVLKVISGSDFELEPVFQAVVETATRLCRADQAVIYRYHDGVYRWAAGTSLLPDYERIERSVSIPPGTGTLVGRVALERRPIEILDALTDPLYEVKDDALVGGIRTLLGVPLMRDGSSIGVIGLARQRVEAFTGRQIELVKTFADQAVIAIENTRLLTEQREALEQQTATAEVLQVINASPGNLTPVFDALLEKALRLCGAAYGVLRSFDGERMRVLASRGVPSDYAGFLAQSAAPVTPGTVPMPGTGLMRALQTRRPAQTLDARESVGYSGSAGGRAIADLGGARTILHVPLVKGQASVGLFTFYRQEVCDFSDKQIALLENFAAQAVVAMDNARLIDEQREALEQQTATAEVLQVINGSPGDLTPVFDAMLEKAMRLCGVAFGMMTTFDGERFRPTVWRGLPAALSGYFAEGGGPSVSSGMHGRLVAGAALAHVVDMKDEAAYNSGYAARRALVDLGGARTGLAIALRKDDALLGTFMLYRQEIRPFTDKQIALLQNFAAQAVIAMENARLLDELRERTEALAQRNGEFGERIEQQAATIDVLKVMSSTPDETKPVFELIVRRAQELCKGVGASLIEFDGTLVHFRATHSPASHSNDPAAVAAWRALFPMVPTLEWLSCRAIIEKREVHIRDLQSDPGLSDIVRATNADIRSHLTVPLMRDGQAIGSISLRGKQPGGFSDSQVALLRTFAEQAVIAIGSVANFRALRERTAELAQRQAELRVTFENMGDGVAMFDETQHLVAWNGKFQEIFDLPHVLLEQNRTYEEHLRFLAARGDFGAGLDTADQIHELVASTGQPYGYERRRPDGRVIEICRNPVPDGGFVLIFSDITERKRSEEEIRAARDAAETALRELRTAQANLFQAEKMASLGQLTAGIAHEIKNPLNFVNNFSDLSVDLLDELQDAIALHQQAEIDELSTTLKGNLQKIVEHGRRADGIVRSMLEHSRGSSGEGRPVDLNVLIDEALNLAYHGARAQDQSFNITLVRAFDEGISLIEVNPQDMTRVFLNLFANGFYAVTRRVRDGETAGFVPTLKVTTIDTGDAVEIRVRDNGTGITGDVRGKIFEPFFTTKPTGEGTGLGLSLSYDIVVKQHGGQLTVDSQPNEFTEFRITLPRAIAESAGRGP